MFSVDTRKYMSVYLYIYEFWEEKPADSLIFILTLSGRLLEARVLKILFLYIRSLLTMDIVKIQLRTLRS